MATRVFAENKTQYHIYLFEHILLCVQESSPTKRLTPSLLFGRPKKSPAEPESKARLILKGRIFGSNVTDVVTLTKPRKLLTCSPHDMFLLAAFSILCHPGILERRSRHRKLQYTLPKRKQNENVGTRDRGYIPHTDPSLRSPPRHPGRLPPPRSPPSDNKPDGNWL